MPADFILPDAAPAPLEGADWNSFVQPIITGITGLDGQFVRPSFQIEPPDLAAEQIVLCVFRYETRRTDNFPYMAQSMDGLTTALQRHEEADVLTSFYDQGTQGNASRYCEVLREGLAIPQNTDVLRAIGAGLVLVGDMITVPIIVKNRWLYRVDMRFTVRRQIDRSYTAPAIIAANFAVVTA